MALVLGPIVGHTDTETSRVWIQVDDAASNYALRIPGIGVFPFVSTEEVVELGTAVATVYGLRPNWLYFYHILHWDRIISGSEGSFRTMPDSFDIRGVSFAVVSCNGNKDLGSWPDLQKYISSGITPVPNRRLRNEKPHFLLMLGDQVYTDNRTNDPSLGDDAWENYIGSSSKERRKVIARWYQQNWGRNIVKQVMANIPTYMIWDDHDIRNGWGSLAHDSPTIAKQFPENAWLQKTYNDIFEDFQYVYWHFQRSHGPSPGAIAPPIPGKRRALPAVFRVSNVLVLMLDSRGDRDVFRDKDDKPALGLEQWEFINNVFGNVPADVDYLVVTTAAPIAHYSNNGVAQRQNVAFGTPASSNYDTQAFQEGKFIGPNGVLLSENKLTKLQQLSALLMLARPLNSVLSIVTDVRDQWPHHYTRAEQEELIRAATKAQFTNRLDGKARELIFIAGDVHFGGDYKIEVLKPTDSEKKSTCTCFFSSGIGKQISDDDLEGAAKRDVRHRFRTKRRFKVAKGIHSKLQKTEWRMNFGIIQTAGAISLGLEKSLQSTMPFSKTKSVARKQKRN